MILVICEKATGNKQLTFWIPVTTGARCSQGNMKASRRCRVAALEERDCPRSPGPSFAPCGVSVWREQRRSCSRTSVRWQCYSFCRTCRTGESSQHKFRQKCRLCCCVVQCWIRDQWGLDIRFRSLFLRSNPTGDARHHWILQLHGWKTAMIHLFLPQNCACFAMIDRVCALLHGHRTCLHQNLQRPFQCQLLPVSLPLKCVQECLSVHFALWFCLEGDSNYLFPKRRSHLCEMPCCACPGKRVHSVVQFHPAD